MVYAPGCAGDDGGSMICRNDNQRVWIISSVLKPGRDRCVERDCLANLLARCGHMILLVDGRTFYLQNEAGLLLLCRVVQQEQGTPGHVQQAWMVGGRKPSKQICGAVPGDGCAMDPLT